ncbi:MAG: glycosyltransferase [Deltaproteobacteria bacterium]|nr:glycosyltransferase [Deltaproteobacteria bacterium]
MDRFPNQAGTNVRGRLSIVIPVRNEAENIRPMLDALAQALQAYAEILIVYDSESDTTLPVVRSLATTPGLEYRTVRNDLGCGPSNALRAGFAAARGEAVVVMMADMSDDLRALGPMIEKFETGYDLVSGSRYMAGGEQVGGPWLKGKLSRIAGVSLNLLGLPVHDATNSFKLYRTERLRRLSLESNHGFEIGLEITVKGWRAGWRITEVPSRWVDRVAGKSNFKLVRWLPRYAKWYAQGCLYGLLSTRHPTVEHDSSGDLR